MIRKILIIVLLFNIVPAYAVDIDQTFGRKIYWWTPSYDRFMSAFGIERSYALVVGVGEYNNSSFSSLPSDKDAIKIKNYLVNEAGFDSVRLLTGNKVTREKIYSLMEGYSKVLNKHDRFLFYWSGHGWTGKSHKKGYLVVKTSTSNPATMLDMHTISSWDNTFTAKQTLYLIDACFSGIAASKAMSPTQEQTIERISRRSRQILTAGLENEETFAIRGQGGVFTRAVLEGLRGKADINEGAFKKDGIVSARELEIFVRKKVDRDRRAYKWSSQITPALYNFSFFEGDFYFVSNKKNLTVTNVKNSGRYLPVDKRVIATGVRGRGANNTSVQKSWSHYHPEAPDCNKTRRHTHKYSTENHHHRYACSAR